ncbi:hypothetical protein [Francisella philomiragia]|uniref:Uncharacterized protein n=1 Tax=Francisella philomiragia TaxID=28110 RepID=A0A0B6CX73_9GAMM|nr:hypothetical protein [Francisella philomiragia]AJI53425.1 hypothetical protein LA55_1250 [Francisella philomiragia]
MKNLIKIRDIANELGIKPSRLKSRAIKLGVKVYKRPEKYGQKRLWLYINKKHHSHLVNDKHIKLVRAPIQCPKINYKSLFACNWANPRGVQL